MSEAQRLWDGRVGELRIEPNDDPQQVMDNPDGRKSNNIFQLAEQMLIRERNYTKAALDELWTFKNGIESRNGKCTRNIEELIEFYQNKMDRLRDREEDLLRISRESIKMIEERGNTGEELERIRRELQDSEGQAKELARKAEQLRSRQTELESFESNCGGKIEANQKQIIEGLFEIALLRKPLADIAAPGQPPEPAVQANIPEVDKMAIRDLDQPEITAAPNNRPFFEKVEKPSMSYPKSIVKTSTGKVIGEYFYDPQLDKDKRNYVFNGRYFVEQLDLGVQLFQSSHEDSAIQTIIQMTADGLSRTAKKDNINFEISTNEILNSKSMTEVLSALRLRDFEQVNQFIRRYRAKQEALAGNYESMLQEQMMRLAGSIAPAV